MHSRLDELLLRVMAQIKDTEEDDVMVVVHDQDDLVEVPEGDWRQVLPEPLCADPDCAACMLLRAARRETIEENPGIIMKSMLGGKPIIHDGGFTL